MQLYYIQCGYKGTNGKIQVEGQDFEGETPADALEMARAFYTQKIPYRALVDMIFSTPTVSNNNQGISRSVSVGGSAANTTIVTGNGNSVIGQHKGGTFIQTNSGNATGVQVSVGAGEVKHIGDVIRIA